MMHPKQMIVYKTMTLNIPTIIDDSKTNCLQVKFDSKIDKAMIEYKAMIVSKAIAGSKGL